MDLALIALLAAIAVQLLPLPAFLVSILSPHRLSFIRAASLGGTEPAFLPLTLDRLATVHGWLATLCACLTFWTARAVFGRGGLRTFGTALAWAAVAFVLVAFAQSASATNLVYGFWRPHDAGARPFGPFINRNHAGTWSLLALFLCFGSLQWRRAAGSPSRARSWRARVAHALDGRQPDARPGDAAADRERGCRRIAIGDGGRLRPPPSSWRSPHPPGRTGDARRCGRRRLRSARCSR